MLPKTESPIVVESIMKDFQLSDYLERFWFLVNYKSKLL